MAQVGNIFFNQSTLKVAKNLLGKILVRKINNKVYWYRITETEAYCGQKDLANHASRGKTKRTEPMFGPPGTIYVYLIYGMYYCLNFVTKKEGQPEAVLIRAVEPLFETTQNPVGPGRLCRDLKIDKKLNNKLIGEKIGLWLEDDDCKVKISDIGKSPRRGVAYAGEYAFKPWRFYLKNSKFVS